LALRGGNSITRRDLPPHISNLVPAGAEAQTLEEPPTLTLDEVERRYIFRVLEASRGNKLKAASILGIDRSTLHRKLKQVQGAAALPLRS